MKRARWLFVAAAVAGIVVLVAPAVGQGKAASRSLEWSRSRGGPTITSYDFGAVDGGSSASKSFRLGSSMLTKSGKLAIRLTGSSAFSITSDKCTGKSIGQSLSCWVRMTYAPLGAPTSDTATLRATDEHGAAANLSLSGSNLGPSGDVYFLDVVGASATGMVNAVSRGGGSVTTLATDQYPAVSVAVDGTHVYWVDSGGSVKKVPLGGGSVTTLATGQNDPLSVEVDDTHVYWVNFYGGTVNAVPVGGGSVTTLASGQYNPRSVAVDGTHVYWVNYGTLGDESDSVTTDGTVNEVPISGGAVTTLASGQNNPSSLAVDGTNVYWVTGSWGSYAGLGTVNAVPVGGGTVTTLATGQNDPTSVATDGTNVYWVDQWSGGVRQVPVGGGPVNTVARGQSHPEWVGVGH